MIILADMIDRPEDLTKFQRIYNKYKNTMYSVAYDISKNKHNAEDIVENSLIKIIQILNKIDSNDINQARTKNLMITITKNTALDYINKLDNKVIPQEYIENYRQKSDVENLYINMENYQLLIQCVNALNDKYKDVFRLKVLHELNSKEISDLLSITEHNVNMRYMRAKEMLKQMLKEQGING